MLVNHLILTCIICVIYVISNSALEFGSFDLIISGFEKCRGPKRQECCETNVTISDQRKLDFSIYVKENVKTTKVSNAPWCYPWKYFTKGKIVALAQGKETLRLQLKNPCEHLFMRPLFYTMFNITRDCLILKGQYHFMVDIQDVAKNYYNGDFIFGKWTFKSVFYNDNCNFSCSVINVEMLPKNKTSKH